MRSVRPWVLAACLLPLLAVLLALLLALERAPRVAAREQVSPADVARGVALARQHDPRRMQPGQLRWVALGERDLDLLLHQAARRWFAARTRVQVQPGALTVQASLPAPLGFWVNAELGLRQTAGVPAVDHLRIGHLPLPGRWALPLLRFAAARHGVPPEAWRATDGLEQVLLFQGRLLASYRIGPQTLNQLRSALLPPDERLRLKAHAEQLAAITRAWQSDSASLADLLPPLIRLAAERSATADGDAAAENRAALLVLAAYALQQPLADWLPEAAGWARPKRLRISLQQREDFPLHFLVSAVIAAEAGTPLADAVGTWKELADARRGGSGFSYQDLVADRAGVRFGEQAVRAPAQLQARVAAGLSDAGLMPPAADLPEFMPEDAYLARYGGPQGAGHLRMVAEIESRLDRLPLYR
ncbi:hypothetical protein [Aquabacterium sp.]|uniref:hypothetical protein n=1 Tax=Aquabacterium sp. TaxID=1872578 RepID=UPI003783B7DA